MIRDLTMIFAVFISLISVVFGFYKNIEANNAKAFAYEQAYRVMSVMPASLRSAALAKLAPVPPVIDLSRSSADNTAPAACTVSKEAQCTAWATDLATANQSCAKKVPSACASAAELEQQIIAGACIACFK